MDERKANYQPPSGETRRANFLFSVTQALILSTGDVSISKNRLFAIITQPPGIRRTNLGGRTGKILRPSSVALKSKNQEINRLQLAVKLPWAIFFESLDMLS
ncbi:hypothetical protein TNCV_652081 [Trichonephila clavipes]|nr:hypothetical protein TNCV_652081 [Trichonephila clavipes]